jgi:hypothetical protein
MSFSQKIKEEVLVLSARHCCVCHKSKGVKLEVHHIIPKQQGGLDTIENAICLCFDCHADAGHYFAGHPKGIKFSPNELLKHKEAWFKIVREHKILPAIKSITGNISKLNYKLKMQQKVFKELIDHEFVRKQELGYFIYNTSHMFISLKVIIRSVDDVMYPRFYPEDYTGITGWFKVMIYNTYHNGIELWLDPGQGRKAIMDKNGYWELLEDRFDARLQSSEYVGLDTKMIGQIPYNNIVAIEARGDEYAPEPHIYCKFANDGQPYENIYYKSFGSPENYIPDMELDVEKMTVFG